MIYDPAFFHKPTTPYGSPADKGKVWGHLVPESVKGRHITYAADCLCFAKKPGSFPLKSARLCLPSNSP